MSQLHTDVDAKHLAELLRRASRMTFCARIVARCAALGLLCGALFLVRPASAQAITYTPCASLSAQVTVSNSVDPGYVGLYKYVVTVAWNVGAHDPSHVDLLLALNDRG